MILEVQEAVQFLSTFMFGRIPRSRVKSFCGHLSSLLSEAIDAKRCVDRYDLIVFADGRSDDTIVQAARRAYVHLGELQECMNNGLIMEIMNGRVRALTPFSSQVVFPKTMASIGEYEKL
ncbi:VWFA domain-containing protein [Caenorhabditis elegans]|uniref:VWFA domain-containing protein n=1 Tax=Caenorhabditis elegans TaxID=6239 RepID=O02156_CAEEL|nr:VWFA domain-containing protein [Caenorhabditis elegans]CCD71995.1 VWFA domain-containing protein [Caenorhabditis elegans]|eukprot:NP_491775.2 Uncharacterized protein CELE_T09B4.6 [Caenorhabditis elegans]